MKKQISGFSKLSKIEKIDWVTNTYFNDPQKAKNTLRDYWNSNIEIQNKHDEFIENTLSNFYIPLGVAPNFIINGDFTTLSCDDYNDNSSTEDEEYYDDEEDYDEVETELLEDDEDNLDITSGIAIHEKLHLQLFVSHSRSAKRPRTVSHARR